MKDFYEQVYARDSDRGEAHAFLCLKDTNICITVNCKCGQQGHFDGYFFYFYECPKCHIKYAIGQNVKMILLTKDEIEYVEKVTCGFKTCEIEDDSSAQV